MANFIRPEKLAKIGEGIAAGLSGRAIARLAGVSYNTVLRYLPAERPACACGQSAGHRGWCGVRYRRSPSRQAFIARWRRPVRDQEEEQRLAAMTPFERQLERVRNGAGIVVKTRPLERDYDFSLTGSSLA